MMDLLLNLVASAIYLGLGGILLLAGRKYIWVLLGAGGLLATATLLAEIQGYPSSWSLVEERLWTSILIAIGVGIVGVLIGRTSPNLTVSIIGFAAGIIVAAWFDEILLAVSGRSETEFSLWLGLLFVAAGLLGVWLARKDPDQALILISVLIGAVTIRNGLNLDVSKSYTAVIVLGLALTGVVVQYASYLREKPRLGNRLPPVPHPVSDELPYE